MVTAIRFDESQVTNGAQAAIESGLPYMARVTLQGSCPLLLHAWNNESVEEKGKSAKGSKAKKTDDIESYVYRTDEGHLGIPGPNLAAAIALAGKFMQDPRSPRKSAFDLCRAAIVPLSIVAPFQPLTKEWDYLDKRRVTIQRNGITRTRPAMKEGWRASFDLLVNLSEYITPTILAKLVGDAGRLVGVCDFRPTYGRFSVVGFDVNAATADI